MKRLPFLAALSILALNTLFCQAQTTFIDTAGLVFSSGAPKHQGTRYDETCKANFDIYKVRLKVENKNDNKGAKVAPIAHFNGKGCTKIYSNDGIAGGEIATKLFSIDATAEARAKYWVNTTVHLLPGDTISAEGLFEVKQGDPLPVPTFYFQYELIPSKGAAVPDISSQTTTANESREIRPAAPATTTSAVKPNTAEVYLQGVKSTYTVRARIDDVQCPGSLRIGMDPDAYDGKKLTIYVMPKAASGAFLSDNLGGNCAMHAILSWMEGGKYRYTSPNISVTKTGTNSFTFTGSLHTGEKISGSGNYTLP